MNEFFRGLLLLCMREPPTLSGHRGVEKQCSHMSGDGLWHHYSCS